MSNRLPAIVTSALILGMTVPSETTIAPPTIPERHVGHEESLSRTPDRMRHHFQPGDKPLPMNLDVFTETYAEGYGPRETYTKQRGFQAPTGVEFYLHTKGPKVGKTIAHKGPWSYDEVRYAHAHGLVLQTRSDRRGRDRANAINRRLAVKRILAGASA